MKRTTGVAMALAVTLLATMRGQQAQVPPGPEYVPGEVLVQYARAATPTRRAAVLSNRRARLLRRYAEVDTDRVELAAGESLDDALRAFRALPDVAAVQPNYVRHIVATVPNDPQWASLWGMMTIQMPQAWDLARGNGSVVIMDIDTGIDYNHEDLAANVWNNPGETANGLDDDGDGYVDDLHGINTITGSGNPLDDNGHGSHTAGTLAAVGNNGTGVVGVNWNAKVIACKFLDRNGSGTDGDAIECLNYAVFLKTQRGINIRVTSNSWGGPRGNSNPAPLENAFDAAGNAGIINFVAAGNSGLNIDIPANRFDPASFSPASPSVVAVASTSSTDALSGFSNYGPNTVALAAPGEGILSTLPGNMYGTASGTSMATPHAAGVAALLSSMDSSLNVLQLKAFITNNVDVLGALANKVTTGGRLNAFRAASAVSPSAGASAVFINTDSSTQGNWQGVYGGEGQSIVGDVTSLPAYASLTSTGLTYTWDPAPSDLRALKRVGTGRVAATWYSGSSFDLDVNVTSGTHQVALYCLDWDTTSRSQRIDVLDATTSAVLDTRTVTSFTGGKFLSWNVTGHVKFRMTLLAGANAVVSGVFFGAAGAPNHPPTATLTGPPDSSSFTAPATVALTATASDPDVGDTIDHVTFYANGSPVGTSSVPVAGIYSYSWTNVGAGPYALTAVSFDNHGAPSATSNTRNITVTGGSGGPSAVFINTDSSTQGNWQGVYGGDGQSIVGDVTSLPAYASLTSTGLQYMWDPAPSDLRALKRVGTGRVAATWYSGSSFDLDVNVTSGTHQVALYCLDWDTTSRSQRIDVLDAATSAILDTRTVTSFTGGKYLSWNVAGHVKFRMTTLAVNAVVSGVFFGAAGAPNHSPTVTLTGPPDSSSYAAPATVALTATASDPDMGDTIDHVTFYGNGSPVGTSSVPVAGIYSYSWTNVGAGPYALTAVSFDNHGAPSATSNTRNITVTGGSGGPSAVFINTDSSTQGNWQGVYGGDGQSIVGDVTSLPAYASLTSTGLQYMWDPAPSDLRALKRVGTGRVAATWYSGSSFDLDVNVTSGTHQVALYCLDWDTTSRSQRIDVLDAATSAILDTRTVTSFTGGKYLSWNVTGHVKFRMTTLAVNAVVSGVFFGSVPSPVALSMPGDAALHSPQGVRGRK